MKWRPSEETVAAADANPIPPADSSLAAQVKRLEGDAKIFRDLSAVLVNHTHPHLIETHVGTLKRIIRERDEAFRMLTLPIYIGMDPAFERDSTVVTFATPEGALVRDVDVKVEASSAGPVSVDAKWTEIPDQSERIRELEQHNAKLDSCLSDATKDAAQLRQKNAELERRLQMQRDVSSQLSWQLDRADQQIRNLVATLRVEQARNPRPEMVFMGRQCGKSAMQRAFAENGYIAELKQENERLREERPEIKVFSNSDYDEVTVSFRGLDTVIKL